MGSVEVFHVEHGDASGISRRVKRTLLSGQGLDSILVPNPGPLAPEVLDPTDDRRTFLDLGGWKARSGVRN